MAYLSLYRRWRPLTFNDMTGQEHITRTLSNALIAERLAHAYLFCGPRGTGKTTAAKILARAMNCEQYPVSEPCGKCGSCLNIAAGVSLDVIEMDAASNRGIDEIRELRERSRFASGEGSFKVYIIDEAHMLTPEACNAFLKTLEEPPQNVIFILATTDPSRLPSTIVSRCQRFDFHLLAVSLIRKRLFYILSEEGWKAEDEALDMIARLADGSMRDALGILEQCSAYGEDQITAEQVRIVTGATRIDVIETLIKAAMENDLNSGLAVLEEVIYSGRDLNLFMRDFTFVITRLLLDETGQTLSDNLQGFGEIVEQSRGKIEKHLLLDAVELLHEVSGELRHAHFPRYILEVAFIRLLRVLHGRLKPVSVWQNIKGEAPEPDVASQAGAAGEIESSSASPAEKVIEKTGEKKEQVVTEEVTESQESEVEAPVLSGDSAADRCARIKESWPAILSEIKKRQKTTAAWLEPAGINEIPGQLVKLIYAPEYEIHKIRIMEDQHRKLVESVISSFCGSAMTIKSETGEVNEENRVTPGKSEDKTPHQKEDPVKKPESELKDSASAEEAMEMFGGKIIDENGEES